MDQRQDFREQLRRQLGFIESSCSAYDAGRETEPIRVAAALRVIFHDTRRSKSLLSHLFAGQLPLLSTTPRLGEASGEAVFFHGALVVCLSTSGEGFYKAPLADVPVKEFLHRAEWWRQVLYIRKESSSCTIKMSRKDIVLDACNKDGGAHVDAKLPARYRELKAGPWSVWTYSAQGVVQHRLPDAQLPMLRQVGYEILHSPSLIQLVRPS